MIGKFALSLASLGLCDGARGADVRDAPDREARHSGDEDSGARPRPRSPRPPRSRPRPRLRSRTTTETKAQKKSAEERRRLTRGGRGEEEGGQEGGRAAEKTNDEADDGHVTGTGGKACRSQHEQVGEGPSARQRTGCGTSPEASPAPLPSNRRGASLCGEWDIAKHALTGARRRLARVVAGEGIEPPTRGFSVRCSTN